MRGEIRTFSDQFAVQVFPGNPYQRPMRVEVKAYDDKFAPIEAVVTPSAAAVSPQDNRSALVVVPLEGRLERRVRICAESVPYKNNTSRLRIQVCGHFIAYRMQ